MSGRRKKQTNPMRIPPRRGSEEDPAMRSGYPPGALSLRAALATQTTPTRSSQPPAARPQTPEADARPRRASSRTPRRSKEAALSQRAAQSSGSTGTEEEQRLVKHKPPRSPAKPAPAAAAATRARHEDTPRRRAVPLRLSPVGAEARRPRMTSTERRAVPKTTARQLATRTPPGIGAKRAPSAAMTPYRMLTPQRLHFHSDEAEPGPSTSTERPAERQLVKHKPPRTPQKRPLPSKAKTSEAPQAVGQSRTPRRTKEAALKNLKEWSESTETEEDRRAKRKSPRNPLKPSPATRSRGRRARSAPHGRRPAASRRSSDSSPTPPAAWGRHSDPWSRQKPGSSRAIGWTPTSRGYSPVFSRPYSYIPGILKKSKVAGSMVSPSSSRTETPSPPSTSPSGTTSPAESSSGTTTSSPPESTPRIDKPSPAQTQAQLTSLTDTTSPAQFTSRPGTASPAQSTSRPGTASPAQSTSRPGTASPAQSTSRPGTASPARSTSRTETASTTPLSSSSTSPVPPSTSFPSPPLPKSTEISCQPSAPSITTDTAPSTTTDAPITSTSITSVTLASWTGVQMMSLEETDGSRSLDRSVSQPTSEERRRSRKQDLRRWSSGSCPVEVLSEQFQTLQSGSPEGKRTQSSLQYRRRGDARRHSLGAAQRGRTATRQLDVTAPPAGRPRGQSPPRGAARRGRRRRGLVKVPTPPSQPQPAQTPRCAIPRLSQRTVPGAARPSRKTSPATTSQQVTRPSWGDYNWSPRHKTTRQLPTGVSRTQPLTTAVPPAAASRRQMLPPTGMTSAAAHRTRPIMSTVPSPAASTRETLPTGVTSAAAHRTRPVSTAARPDERHGGGLGTVAQLSPPLPQDEGERAGGGGGDSGDGGDQPRVEEDAGESPAAVWPGRRGSCHQQ